MGSWSLTVVRPQHELGNEDAASMDIGAPQTEYHAQLRKLQAIGFVLKPDLGVYWPATEYLAEVGLVSMSATGDTVRTYGEALVCWFRHLEAAGKDPADASLADLKAYRTVLLRGNGYASTTAQIRFGSVCRFYRWSQEVGSLQSALGSSLLDSGTDSKSARTMWARQAPSLSQFVYSRLPRVVTASELRCIVDIAPQPYSLMFKWAACTGMRRFELCNLRIDTFEYLARDAKRYPDDLASADIIRKGGRVRSVYVPRQLIQDTERYLLFERQVPQAEAECYVFIGRSGNRISKSRLSAQFSKIAAQVGVSATLHHLRHTYAVVVLAQLQEKAARGAAVNPLKTLQILMGHADLSTTEIYLRAIEVNSSEVKEALAYLYGDTR